jgi:hypothetical protein
MREVTIANTISAPVNFIVHSIADVNDQLQRGRPFFVDIIRDGIALYELEGHELEPPKALSAEEQRKEAKRYFDEWFPSAATFRETGNDLISRDRPKEAAFLLHQATERFYHCALLVLTLYSPKSHKLNFLRSQAESHEPRLFHAWPRDTKFVQRCFELLRRAYVEARYSPHYTITADELAWIATRVEVLQGLVWSICEGELARGNASPSASSSTAQ